MRINWKKIFIVTLDLVLAGYLVLAFSAFNKPDKSNYVCTKTSINIEDETNDGFITTKEIKRRLEAQRIYPLNRKMVDINAREIEDMLKASPFVKTAECYKTQDGQVEINLTQLLPVARVKSINGNDYYLDDKDCIMPNTHYTSDLIIATGYINKWYACNYIAPLSKAIIANDLWRNQIEQINVLKDKGIELIPRKFYRYGLSQAGWNKYSYINLDFDNQIICKKYPNIE